MVQDVACLPSHTRIIKMSLNSAKAVTPESGYVIACLQVQLDNQLLIIEGEDMFARSFMKQLAY